MEYIGPAVMAALVVTMLVTPQGDLMLGAPEVGALAVAGLVAWRSRNHLLTMTTFWVLRALSG
jgi:branched-subunit amino acid transport protein